MYKTKNFKRFLSMMLAVSIAVIFCLPASAYYTEDSKSSVISEGYYTIRALCNGKYLDANSTQIQIWDKDSKRNQAFYFSRYGNSWIIFSNSSNKAISVDGYEDRSVLIQQNCTGAANQLWDIVYNSDNTYSFVNLNSKKYMDVYNGDSSNGTRIIQFYSHGGINQKFELQKVNVYQEQNHNTYDPYNRYDYDDPYGPYDPDDSDEISIYDDDDDDVIEINNDNYYNIVNNTDYDLDGEIPNAKQTYLAEVSYFDSEDVLDMFYDNDMSASEYKIFYKAACKGRTDNKLNKLIRKVYVTFDVTYKNNRVYINTATKSIKYIKWTKNNAKKTTQELNDWTEIE